MNRVLKYHWGNPSSGYQKGKTAFQIVEQAREQAREQAAESIHAHSHEIYFTGCATESNNTVLKTLCNHFYPKKRKIISTPIEHPSVMNRLEFLETQGILVQYCPVDRLAIIGTSSDLKGIMVADQSKRGNTNTLHIKTTIHISLSIA